MQEDSIGPEFSGGEWREAKLEQGELLNTSAGAVSGAFLLLTLQRAVKVGSHYLGVQVSAHTQDVSGHVAALHCLSMGARCRRRYTTLAAYPAFARHDAPFIDLLRRRASLASAETPLYLLAATPPRRQCTWAFVCLNMLSAQSPDVRARDAEGSFKRCFGVAKTAGCQ